jgi:hypothetical protein
MNESVNLLTYNQHLLNWVLINMQFWHECYTSCTSMHQITLNGKLVCMHACMNKWMNYVCQSNHDGMIWMYYIHFLAGNGGWNLWYDIHIWLFAWWWWSRRHGLSEWASELASCARKMASYNSVQKRGCASWEIEHKSRLICHASMFHKLLSVLESLLWSCPSIHPSIHHPSIPTSVPPPSQPWGGSGRGATK